MSTYARETSQYRWWLVDADLLLVAGGSVKGESLAEALARVSADLDRLPDQGLRPTNHPYRLMVYRDGAVVAVRPPTVGIC